MEGVGELRSLARLEEQYVRDKHLTYDELLAKYGELYEAFVQMKRERDMYQSFYSGVKTYIRIDGKGNFFLHREVKAHVGRLVEEIREKESEYK